MRSSFALLSPAAAAAVLADALPRVRAHPLGVSVADVPAISARLFCGDFEDVRRVLMSAEPDAALPLGAARYHAWSGDLATLLQVFDRVRASIELAQARPEVGGRSWTEVERAATDAGDPILAARLARLARTDDSAPAHAPPAGDPAAALLAIANGLLGIEPDAHRGRIRLRPRLVGVDGIEMRELRFGDGAVSLAIERRADGVTCSIVQEAGAMPFTALLEPIVERASAAAVDGRPAQLDIRLWEDGMIAPVQLVLDDTRTLELF